jgi:hypothetical protein
MYPIGYALIYSFILLESNTEFYFNSYIHSPFIEDQYTLVQPFFVKEQSDMHIIAILNSERFKNDNSHFLTYDDYINTMKISNEVKEKININKRKI